MWEGYICAGRDRVIAGLANGFPDGELYVIIGRQRGEVYEKNKGSVLDLFEDLSLIHI